MKNRSYVEILLLIIVFITGMGSMGCACGRNSGQSETQEFQKIMEMEAK